MQGFLDERRNAYLTIDFGQGPYDLMVDTGFDGSLCVGRELFDSTGLQLFGEMDTELAANKNQRYDCYIVRFDWMDEETETLVMVGPGTDCLIGTALLEPHRLEIDYEKRSVELIRGSSW